MAGSWAVLTSLFTGTTMGMACGSPVQPLPTLLVGLVGAFWVWWGNMRAPVFTSAWAQSVVSSLVCAAIFWLADVAVRGYGFWIPASMALAWGLMAGGHWMLWQQRLTCVNGVTPLSTRATFAVTVWLGHLLLALLLWQVVAPDGAVWGLLASPWVLWMLARPPSALTVALSWLTHAVLLSAGLLRWV